MSKISFHPGQSAVFSKTISESDIYLFAGITGDFSPNHIDAEYMKRTHYKKRIAHGVLSIGISSTASTKFAEMSTSPCVSYGYDKIRFLKPIFIGDTITVTYTCFEVDYENNKTFSEIEITNQNGELCTVGTHILKFL
ncbi:MaoC domain protein dehydratase [Tepidanaerobacter acetatoxydans Re1]|uniref:MaoC domain protein dehydratase n=1 Tax=Tepidanaerobacter acetatoxydans (strain DSM 21804 / JCM 16047 / Re1) TaxID=1209989 RepID=F4LXM9_TEPAE|nr:MaoC family dehydratase [Tepidanaerobacter acetatoxydans]AEE91958.1 MaoC domain protein dehydratase [Tepidanaerobacter acetatoxydans Re1]CCP26789.1 MaoC domain protein dehydratase [Tepidanaerobacter acetatoxydans Re1]